MKRLLNNLSKTKLLINPIYLNKKLYPILPYMSVTTRIVISQKYKFVYIRIPKAANSTVTVQLWKCMTGEHLDTTQNIGEIKKSFLNTKKASIKQAFFARKNYYFFIIVRNPYERVLSAYLDKFSTDKYIKRFGEQVKSAGDGNLSFKSFCKFLKQGGLYSDPHWLPQSKFMWPTKYRLNYIGKVERLNDDLQNIFTKLFGNCCVDLSNNYGSHQTYSTTKKDEYYDRECIDIINDLYLEDFNNFDYKLD